MSTDLCRLALAVLQPGFEGTTAPDWLRRALGDGLGGAVLFARNLPSDTLVPQLRAENPDVIVAVDEEGGVVTRLEAHTGSSFPGNRALGVVDDVDLTERVAHQIGRLLAAADVTLDYAPSVDVNANPENPVIGVRSFGPTPDLVARHSAAYVRGLQAAGVAACAKHFPGHGDTITDSHLALPTVHADVDTLRARDLPPFRAAIAAGVRAVMCGHLLVPALDPDQPATLSRTVLTGLLRGELGFDGLLVTDAIEMKAVAARHSLGEIAVRALAAGVDAVCIGITDERGLHELRDAVVAAVRSGALPEERLAEAAGRVQSLAEWYGKQSRPAAAFEPGVGLEAARAALTTSGTATLVSAPVVVEVNTRLNQAVDSTAPTGLTAALDARLPGTTRVAMAPESGLPELDRNRPLVLVVHDSARHAWVRERIAQAVQARPDVIVVDTGIAAPAPAATFVSTHGISRASAEAAAEWLTTTREASG
ncbi:glycoside hydrolase family 3 protein [Nonomuraea longicatena]|uniref:Glycoside hydrolase family 3 N-terminal domain-containing protein n=1 Tax=Nonomuraea longicatena TaxID=83682 RepID=A0ABP3ZJY6_9ACTN